MYTDPIPGSTFQYQVNNIPEMGYKETRNMILKLMFLAIFLHTEHNKK